jgi:hypothetical protein
MNAAATERRGSMDSRFEESGDAQTMLPETVRQAAASLLSLLKNTSGLTPDAASILRAACEGVARRLSETRFSLALVGEAGAGRRTLVNAVLGDRVLATGKPRRGSTVTIVRHASALDFVARSLDGRTVAQLSRKVPDRDALFEKSMGQMQRETTAREDLTSRLQAARARADALQTSIAVRRELEPPHLEPPHEETAKARDDAEKPSPPRPSFYGTPRPWWAVWWWILHVLLWPFRRRWLPPPPARSADAGPSRNGTASADEQRRGQAARLHEERDAIAALERELARMPDGEQIAMRVDRIRRERDKYESERRSAFLSQVRDFDGTDIAERVVDYPAKHLPDAVVLMDLPCPAIADTPAAEQVRKRVAREVDALVLVADIQRPLGAATASLVRELKGVVPLVLVVLTKGDTPRHDAVVANGAVASRIRRAQKDAFDRIVRALGPGSEQTPCVGVAAESGLDAGLGPPSLSEHCGQTIGRLLDGIRDERPVLLAWREAMRMRVGVAELAQARAREEQSRRKRLAALESQRITDPLEFRRRLLTRVEAAIEKCADDVLEGAMRSLHAAFDGLRAEWKESISSATTRSAVEARVAAINESAAQRIADVLEGTAEHVARELNDATETLETWALEEIRTHYQLVRRLGADVLAPVASELTREDLERELGGVQPVQGAMNAFEKQRVGYGLGGVAAGAVLGTLIAPGIGTAVGAVLGVLAGLLKGIDSLKQECIAKIDACLNDAESHASAQLHSKRPDLSRVIRVTLDEALEEALRQLNDAIVRLKDLERRAIDGERAKIDELTADRGALEACDARLVGVIEVATSKRSRAG